MKNTEIARVLKEDKWSLTKGEYEGKPVVVRYRESLLSVSDVSGYDQLVRIVWPYGGEVESGMPSDKDLAMLDKFEELLLEALEFDARAVCSAVITTWGYREWVFYTDDFEECSERISKIPNDRSPYPIELEAEHDEDWHYFRDNILAGMRE